MLCVGQSVMLLPMIPPRRSADIFWVIIEFVNHFNIGTRRGMASGSSDYNDDLGRRRDQCYGTVLYELDLHNHVYNTRCAYYIQNEQERLIWSLINLS